MNNPKQLNSDLFRKISSSISLISILIIGYGVVRIQQKQLVEIEKNKITNYAKEEEYQKSRLSLLTKTPTFGFDNLISNLVYLDFVQYFGDFEARKQLGSSLIPNYFQTVVKHDPLFVGAYLHLAPANTMYAGEPLKTVAIMSEGLKSLVPQIDKSYLVWTYKGVDELLFLGDKQAAKNSYATGAEWASFHADERSKFIGNRAKETAEFLASNPDSRKAQASAWMTIFNSIKDRRVKQMALQQIQSLGGKVSITEQGVNVQMPEYD